ncbi:MAG: ABC transporter permease, partial [Bacteroidales bacterium]|nr:ABC transporter permease [Bacteroidales bacterium]
TYIVPGVLMLFVFLLVPYSIWTEVKFGRSKDWIQMAGGNIHIALLGKLLPHTLMFIAVFLGFEFYIYGVLDFPHQGGIVPIVLVGVMSVLACQGFGVFISGIMPSLRMSMSICSLWAVVSFSMCGATYPVEAMDRMVHAMAVLFPLRHYIVIYQINIFDGFPLQYTSWNFAALLFFILLPVLSAGRIKKNMLQSVYIP